MFSVFTVVAVNSEIVRRKTNHIYRVKCPDGPTFFCPELQTINGSELYRYITEVNFSGKLLRSWIVDRKVKVNANQTIQIRTTTR